MGLPVSIHLKYVRLARRLPLVLALVLVGPLTILSLVPAAMAQDVPSQSSEQQQLHQSPQWAAIAKHLPDPATATPELLEQQADILRARRFPEDAMEYYKYALARGGSQVSLLNKMGLTELELRNIELARGFFRQVVKMDRKNPEAWNNLGAVEYVDGSSRRAVSDYKRAVKLDKEQAVFHANLATAYFGMKSYSHARREIAAALKLDPQIFSDDNSGGGVSAHVLSAEERARFSFEMAKMYARNGLVDQMLHSLAMASEAGMDVQREMLRDPVLAKFEMDPRVVVIVHNAQALRVLRGASADNVGSAPALPAQKQMSE